MNRRISVLAALCLLTVARGGGLVAFQQARTLTSALPAKVVNRQMQPLVDGTRRGVHLGA